MKFSWQSYIATNLMRRISKNQISYTGEKERERDRHVQKGSERKGEIERQTDRQTVISHGAERVSLK